MSRHPPSRPSGSSRRERTPDVHANDGTVYDLRNSWGDALPYIGNIAPLPTFPSIPDRPTPSSLGWTPDSFHLQRLYKRISTSFDGPHWELHSYLKPTPEMPLRVYPEDEEQIRMLTQAAESQTESTLPNSKSYIPSSTQTEEANPLSTTYPQSSYPGPSFEGAQNAPPLPLAQPQVNNTFAGYAQSFYQASQTQQYPSQSTLYPTTNTQPPTYPLPAYAGAPSTERELPQSLTQIEADRAVPRQSYYTPSSIIDRQSVQASANHSEAKSKSKPPHQSNRRTSTKGADAPVEQKKDTCHLCGKSYGRPADLKRHISSKHEKDNPANTSFRCDYERCKYLNNREDHFVEHLRDYHKEDLPRKTKGREIGESANWWSERNNKRRWWRCDTCFGRVDINFYGWTCFCTKRCSASRISARSTRSARSASPAPRNPTSNQTYDPYSVPEVQTAPTSGPETQCSLCFGCGWILNAVSSWVFCPSCFPNADNTAPSNFAPVSHNLQHGQSIPIPQQSEPVPEADSQAQQSDQQEVLCNLCEETPLVWNEDAGKYDACPNCYYVPR